MDVRFIRRLVLRMLEMLYYEQKWEKLVDIALRFNALTKLADISVFCLLLFLELSNLCLAYQ